MPSHAERIDIPQERQVLVRTCRIATCGLLRDLLELIRGEVRRVGDGSQTWDERCLDVADGGPVDAVEKGVVFDLFDG